MIRCSMDLSKITPLNRLQIERLVRLAGRYSSRVLYEHKNRQINGKSMLGLLSMGVTGMDEVILTVEGEDEEAAANALRQVLEEGVAPPKDMSDADKLVQYIKEKYQEILKENLTGIYLHGSLAANCFHWEKSDIDLLVVVNEEPSVEKKIALVETLYALEKDAPPAGFEMSVVLAADCKEPQPPMPYVLHYSKMWTAEYEKDPRGYCERMHGTDPDLTTHILSLHAYGETVLGPGVNRVFGSIKKEDAMEAIRADLSDAAESLDKNPVYVVLTLCRALAYFREGLVLTKMSGGEWAIKNLHHRYQGVIQAALNAYNESREMYFDRERAEDLCYDAMEEISAE